MHFRIHVLSVLNIFYQMSYRQLNQSSRVDMDEFFSDLTVAEPEFARFVRNHQPLPMFLYM